MPDPERSKFSRKARKRGQIEEVDKQHKRLHHSMLASETWKHLPPPAIKVLIELWRRFNGRNNGQISLSRNEAVKLLHIGKGTAQKAFETLIEMGFIKIARRGSFCGRRATEYILTDTPYQGHNATNEWRQWRPPKKKRKQSFGIETIREESYLEIETQKF